MPRKKSVWWRGLDGISVKKACLRSLQNGGKTLLVRADIPGEPHYRPGQVLLIDDGDRDDSKRVWTCRVRCFWRFAASTNPHTLEVIAATFDITRFDHGDRNQLIIYLSHTFELHDKAALFVLEVEAISHEEAAAEARRRQEGNLQRG